MRQRDLQQALLRGASINDTAFATFGAGELRMNSDFSAFSSFRGLLVSNDFQLFSSFR